MGQQRVDQRLVGIARRRMDHHPGGLVQDQQVGVLEQDLQRHVLRLRGSGFGLGNVDDDDVARFDLAGRLFYRLALRQRHAAALDQRLHAASREGRQGSSQRAVQPFAGGALVEGHGVATGVAHGVFLASPAQASAPLWLKVLVIGMGLLIVVGFVVAVGRNRPAHLYAQRRPFASIGHGSGFTERIALPSGARVVSMNAVGDRLVVHVETQGGPASAYVVDPRSGALLGTIEFAGRRPLGTTTLQHEDN